MLETFVCRYLDSVTNKDSTLPPIPHLHSLLTDDGDPHPEVDIFKLVRSSYEVSLRTMTRALSHPPVMQSFLQSVRDVVNFYSVN